MRLTRLGSLVVTLVLVLGAAGCGKDAQDRYCDALKADQSRLADVINSTRDDALVQGLPLLRSLAAEAPDDLTDEWQTLVNAVAGLKQALDKAGLTATQLAKGEGLDTLDAAQKADLTGAASRLASQEVLDAASGIEQQGRDVCKVNLGL